MREPIIHDLNIIKPNPEFIKLGRRMIDVSSIPSGIALQIVEEYEELQASLRDPELMKALAAGEGSASLRVLKQSLDICTRIIRRPFSIREFGKWWSSRGITRRWLINHTDIAQLRTFITVTIDVLFRSMETEGPKKKELVPAKDEE